jgi:hypothetical protein
MSRMSCFPRCTLCPPCPGPLTPTRTQPQTHRESGQGQVSRHLGWRPRWQRTLSMSRSTPLWALRQSPRRRPFSARAVGPVRPNTALRSQLVVDDGEMHVATDPMAEPGPQSNEPARPSLPHGPKELTLLLCDLPWVALPATSSSRDSARGLATQACCTPSWLSFGNGRDRGPPTALGLYGQRHHRHGH